VTPPPVLPTPPDTGGVPVPTAQVQVPLTMEICYEHVNTMLIMLLKGELEDGKTDIFYYYSVTGANKVTLIYDDQDTGWLNLAEVLHQLQAYKGNFGNTNRDVKREWRINILVRLLGRADLREYFDCASVLNMTGRQAYDTFWYKLRIKE
jgi:hypothetical protein